MNYMISFDTREVFAVDYVTAMSCAVALAKSFQHVTIWQGTEVKWEYKNQ